MPANPKAVQVRIALMNASQAGHQRAHDLRIGPQPAYVDPVRTAANRMLIEPTRASELAALCESRRLDRLTPARRAMKSNAAVGIAGIITFGHEAQMMFGELDTLDQDGAYRDIAETVAERLQTSVEGLVVHEDEAAPHAHFLCPAVTFSGHPVSTIAKRDALREIQDIAARVIRDYHGGIERGTPRIERLTEGESYANTVYKSAAEMRERLPADIAAKEAELAAAEARRAKNERLAEKARFDALAEGEKAEKARKRLETYERRAQEASRDVERLEGMLVSLNSRTRAAQTDLAHIEAEVAQKKTRIASLQASLRLWSEPSTA